MNPGRLYQNMKLDAIAKGLSAEKYTTFLAMPFRNNYGYISESMRSRFSEIVTGIDYRTHGLEKPFAVPIRVDDNPPSAADVTEQIAELIMNCHFFLGDLSFGNHGVLLETGMAMAVKPPESITLISQGNSDDLHFDITVNRVNFYSTDAELKKNIENSLVAGAKHYEHLYGRQLHLFRGTLTPEAILLLRIYANTSLQHLEYGIHWGLANEDETWKSNFGDDRAMRYQFYAEAIRELRDKGLIVLDYQPSPTQDGALALYAYHATKLGAEFLRRTWPKELRDFRSQKE